MACDDNGTRIADQREDDYDVAVHAMEEKELVAYDGNKLEDYEEGGGDDGVEVEFHAFCVSSVPDRPKAGKRRTHRS